jgi:hypothetical protein
VHYIAITHDVFSFFQISRALLTIAQLGFGFFICPPLLFFWEFSFLLTARYVMWNCMREYTKETGRKKKTFSRRLYFKEWIPFNRHAMSFCFPQWCLRTCLLRARLVHDTNILCWTFIFVPLEQPESWSLIDNLVLNLRFSLRSKANEMLVRQLESA